MDREIWKAIDWAGDTTGGCHGSADRPTDGDFKQHFEELLGSADYTLETDAVMSDVSTPILDDQITPMEVDQCIRSLKTDKSAGPDGIAPGLFRLLPPVWVVLVTSILNTVFISGTYPPSWCFAKLCVLFKKGNRRLCEDYRGISIMSSLAKLYDMVLCRRLTLWFSPFREQAGSQRNRGCIEHIVTLRLLIDYAFCKRKKLFIVFVDFSKAYDRLDRVKLVNILKKLGCGMVMLAAIVAMYVCTSSILGTSVITTVLGVRQGSPIPCLLFVVFMNELARLYKRCAADGFL